MELEVEVGVERGRQCLPGWWTRCGRERDILGNHCGEGVAYPCKLLLGTNVKKNIYIYVYVVDGFNMARE